MISRFYNILQTHPSIHGDINQDDDIDRYWKDEVTLVFENGSREELTACGSVYDHLPMSRTKMGAYPPKPTREQVEGIVKAVGKEPIVVEYKEENNLTEKQFINELTLEFPWNFVKRVLDSSPRELHEGGDPLEEDNMLRVPYKIVGGEYKLFLKSEKSEDSTQE